MPAGRRTPVHYVTLSYRAPPNETSADQSVCWWGDMTFFGHLFQLLQLRRFEASVVFGPKPIIANHRHVLAEKLWSAVSLQLNNSRTARVVAEAGVLLVALTASERSTKSH